MEVAQEKLGLIMVSFDASGTERLPEKWFGKIFPKNVCLVMFG
jgi:hypothetical protein